MESINIINEDPQGIFASDFLWWLISNSPSDVGMGYNLSYHCLKWDIKAQRNGSMLNLDFNIYSEHKLVLLFNSQTFVHFLALSRLRTYGNTELVKHIVIYLEKVTYFTLKKSNSCQHESACDSTLNGIKGSNSDDFRICSIRPDLKLV